ncbi:hypothetical protein ACLOJK_041142, partial [Asimina triloba]
MYIGERYHRKETGEKKKKNKQTLPCLDSRCICLALEDFLKTMKQLLHMQQNRDEIIDAQMTLALGNRPLYLWLGLSS